MGIENNREGVGAGQWPHARAWNMSTAARNAGLCASSLNTRGDEICRMREHGKKKYQTSRPAQALKKWQGRQRAYCGRSKTLSTSCATRLVRNVGHADVEVGQLRPQNIPVNESEPRLMDRHRRKGVR